MERGRDLAGQRVQGQKHGRMTATQRAEVSATVAGARRSGRTRLLLQVSSLFSSWSELFARCATCLKEEEEEEEEQIVTELPVSLRAQISLASAEERIGMIEVREEGEEAGE
eukprot:760759-Hanusia_phi.AAC.1